MAVTVTLPDGKALELQDGATGADAAAAIGPGLARAALAIEVGAPDPSSADSASDSSPARPRTDRRSASTTSHVSCGILRGHCPTGRGSRS